MAVELKQTDFDRLVVVLSQHGDWQSVRGRIDFMADVFAGSSRKRNILDNLDLDGTPRSTAIRVIGRLARFGQDEVGRESLGVLVNKLLVYLGGGDEANFLQALLLEDSFNTTPAATRAIDTWYGQETAQSVAEKIIGENTLLNISVLEQLLHLSRSVLRISNPKGVGTGFLIASNLVMTNHHVIPDVRTAEQSDFIFNYQLDRFGSESPIQTVKSLKNGMFHTSLMANKNAKQDELDYTIVELQNPREQIPPLPLKATAPLRDSRVIIIQHPGGSYKKISMQNNFVEYVDQFSIQYTTSTEPGSSGSPVFDEWFEVVAIHHAGGNIIEPSTNRRYLRNEAVRMSAILDDLRTKAPDVLREVGG